MLEGLWIVRFLEPNDPTADLNGGVAVIESGKIFGGDSGYFYVGEIEPTSNAVWQMKLQITRHDQNIESVFGDVDQFSLIGSSKQIADDDQGRRRLRVELFLLNGEQGLVAELKKVAELP